MLEAYADGRIDRLYLASNEFENTMTQKPVVRQILPLDPTEDDSYQHRWDYIYEPDAEQFEGLVTRYLNPRLSGGCRERVPVNRLLK